MVAPITISSGPTAILSFGDAPMQPVEHQNIVLGSSSLAGGNHGLPLHCSRLKGVCQQFFVHLYEHQMCHGGACMQVYYCGGIDDNNTHTRSSCAVYDTINREWIQGRDEDRVPDMLRARNHAATCTDGQRMIVFGGRSGKNVLGPSFSHTQARILSK